MYGVIYVIINLLNGMRYVGQTRQRLKKRMYQHSKANSYIGNAIRHHGWKNFTVEVLEECDTPEQLNEREKFWIAYFNCKHPNGYNLTDGGEGSPGCVDSDETRAKKSAAQTGKKLSDEHRAKIGASNTGKHPTAEARTKMSTAHLGEKNHAFGKNLSAEHRAKISAAQRGETPYKNLLNAIIDRQLTYGALAKLLGISQRSVSRKMRGIHGFTAKDIAKLVEIFGLSAEYLMARDD